jgi:hypothetical protein
MRTTFAVMFSLNDLLPPEVGRGIPASVEHVKLKELVRGQPSAISNQPKHVLRLAG